MFLTSKHAGHEEASLREDLYKLAAQMRAAGQESRGKALQRDLYYAMQGGDWEYFQLQKIAKVYRPHS